MCHSARNKSRRPVAWALVALGSLAGCGEEPPPPSVADLVENPVLLDATMVRCLEQHEGTRYAPECISAREAAERLAAVAEKASREELEAQSARKKEALRRAQQAADAANQQAAQLAKEREAAEYLGLLLPAPAIAESTPAEMPPEESRFMSLSDPATPQVTIQDIDISSIAPAAPPEPEPEAE
ncbi:MAG TPA: EexN family lipoprotein [Woeseiaceae bacterium]|nr:EexN family lipoprotein [Woeseiaceae bacterium]